MNNIVEKIQEETNILATKANMELVTTFFEANGLIPGLEVSSYRKVLLTTEETENVFNEKYYNAICIKYSTEDTHIGILLLNLAARHHGLDNMLIDYLRKLNSSPIIMDRVYTKPVTFEEVDKNFLTKVAPILTKVQSKKIPLRKSYAGIKE